MPEMNRKQLRASHSILRKRESNVGIGKEFNEMCKIAHKENMILFGEKTELDGGIFVDFTHFDFVVSIAKFSKAALSNNLKLLREFWISLYPQIERLANTAVKLDEAYHSVLVDQKQVLDGFSDLDFREKKMTEFLDERGLLEAFEVLYAPAFKDMKIEEARIIEEDRVKAKAKELSV